MMACPSWCTIWAILLFLMLPTWKPCIYGLCLSTNKITLTHMALSSFTMLTWHTIFPQQGSAVASLSSCAILLIQSHRYDHRTCGKVSERIYVKSPSPSDNSYLSMATIQKEYNIIVAKSICKHTQIDLWCVGNLIIHFFILPSQSRLNSIDYIFEPQHRTL